MRPRNQRRNTPERIDVDKRRAKCLELRASGLSLRAIAAKVGMAHSSVAEAIEAELDELTKEPAEKLRTVELARLDRLLKAMWAKAMKGDVHRVDRCLRIMERRAKLLGLDAPTKQEHTGKDGAELFGKEPAKMSLAEMQAEMRQLAQDAQATTGNRLPDRDPEDGNAK